MEHVINLLVGITASSGWIATLIIWKVKFCARQRADRNMKLYIKTLEYYQSFSCQLFACMDALCDRKTLEEKGIIVEYLTIDGKKTTEKRKAYDDLLCGAGQATLVADEKTRTLITKLLQSIIKNDMDGKQNECHKKVTDIVNSMNDHLHVLIKKID